MSQGHEHDGRSTVGRMIAIATIAAVTWWLHAHVMPRFVLAGVTGCDGMTYGFA